MAHFAKIVDGLVEQVIVVNNDVLQKNGSEVGDIILYQEGYYEVDVVNSNQYYLGKNPDYPNSPQLQNPGLDEFGYNVSVICETHYVPADKVGITQERL